MCNTREENAAELARGAEKPVVRTTRADLISAEALLKEAVEALKNRYQVLPRSSRPIWWTDDAAWLEYVESDERARALVAQAEGN